jgi:hypothetical protein
MAAPLKSAARIWGAGLVTAGVVLVAWAALQVAIGMASRLPPAWLLLLESLGIATLVIFPIAFGLKALRLTSFGICALAAACIGGGLSAAADLVFDAGRSDGMWWLVALRAVQIGGVVAWGGLLFKPLAFESTGAAKHDHAEGANGQARPVGQLTAGFLWFVAALATIDALSVVLDQHWGVPSIERLVVEYLQTR